MISRRSVSLAAMAILTTAPSAHAQTADDMSIGLESAPLQLLEFASTTCPHCAHFHQTNWPTLKAGYIDRGLLRLTLKEMLTPPPGVALGMFQVARCGGVDGAEYFRRLGVLFERQRAILATGTMVGVRDSLIAIGGEWNLSPEQVMAALNDPTSVDRIRRSIADADARGVTGTPTFFMNGARVADPAFHTPDGLVRVLDAQLGAR
ncbi:MAG: thioredoxin domain-containing protein [Hyphomonadaceae bacterium]|nr:thioredoxin domain-containing protein [Hyphomonadaceae bacterium]